MNFYDLTSIVSANKNPVSLRQPTDSFAVAANRSQPYIEPTFEKVEFEREKPAVILISAVGATGKTALAGVLSNRTGLPLLDLAKHKPVGADTVTGLLTNTFPVADLTTVFQRLGQGAFGIIIDGIDEGRSKTTEKAFEAFLDDIARLCKDAQSASFVLLGRTQILEGCWVYFQYQHVSAGMVTIKPFDLTQARKYVDDFTRGLNSPHAAEYGQVRDMILERLGAAFRDGLPGSEQGFLTFIGYPPVLDAIVALLERETNYHRLREKLDSDVGGGIEVELLHRIADYILQREKKEKILPNIVDELIIELPQERGERIRKSIYGTEEQCVRLVSHCLGKPCELCPIGEPALDNEYEKRLRQPLGEHPFITAIGRQFRNAIFEAFALSTLIISSRGDAVPLALEYVDAHKHNYHLLYLLDRMADSRRVPASVLRVIIGSALEFRSRTVAVDITVGDATLEDTSADSDQPAPVEIEIVMGSNEEHPKRFIFEANVKASDSIHLGERLASTNVFLPCEVLISGPRELEIIAPTAVFAPRIELRSQELVLRAPSRSPEEKMVLLAAADTLRSDVTRIATDGADLVLAVANRAGIAYPAIRYVEEILPFPHDKLLSEKHRRLRRILVLFRSHSRGALARCRAKIEHERVLRNEIGWSILKRLVKDNIVTCDGDFYYLEPKNVGKYLGVSWIDLQKGKTSEKLEEYLRSIS